MVRICNTMHKICTNMHKISKKMHNMQVYHYICIKYEKMQKMHCQKKLNNVKLSRAIMKDKLQEENTKRNMSTLFNY